MGTGSGTPTVSCAQCEEPITVQGVRCSACHASHHPRCFFGKGERCSICHEQGTPALFDIAPSRGEIARFPRARAWSGRLIRAAVPLAVAGIAAWAWFVGSSSTRVPRDSTGALPLRLPVPIAVATGTGGWTPVPLPVDSTCSDLFMRLQSEGPAAAAPEHALAVEVSGGPGTTPEKPWRPLVRLPVISACTAWYRVSSNKGFTGARVSARPASSKITLVDGVVLTQAPPAGVAEGGLKVLTLARVTDTMLVLAYQGATVEVPRAFIDPAGCPVTGRVVDPTTRDTMVLDGALEAQLRTGKGQSQFQPLDWLLGPGNRPGTESLTPWARTVGLWTLLHQWRTPLVKDGVLDPSGSRVILLLQDGRVAVAGVSRDSLQNFESPESARMRSSGPEQAFLRDLAVPRFRRVLGWRPEPAPGDGFALIASPLMPLSRVLTCQRSAPDKVTIGNEKLSGLHATIPGSWLSGELPAGHNNVSLVSLSRLPAAPTTPAPAPSPSTSVSPMPSRPRARDGLLGRIDDEGTAHLRAAVWGMTLAQVKASERLRPSGEVAMKDGTQQLLYRVIGPGQRTFLVMYVFQKGRLYGGNLFLERALAPGGPEAELEFFRNLLTSSYGAPDSVAKLRETVVRSGWAVGKASLALWFNTDSKGAKSLQIEIVNHSQRLALSK